MQKLWYNVLFKSEKIVSSPSSFINIKYLLNDELANVVSEVRKLIGTRHPILKNARNIIDGNHGVSQIRGLILLLLSKSFNDSSVTLNRDQKSLSEIVETAHMAINIHKGIIDIRSTDKSIKWKNDMQFGNKMATLCGDYLLSAVSRALGDLRNTEIVDNVSKGIGDSIESVFESKQKSVDNYEKYKFAAYLSSGSLLSKCCRASIILKSDKSDISEDKLFELGDIAQKWSIYWAELYSICADISNMVAVLSDGSIKSGIFLSADIEPEAFSHLDKRSVENGLHILENVCNKMHQQHNKLVGLGDSKSEQLLEEITDLLYTDAKNICSSFLS